MSAEPTWQELAHLLAEQLRDHARCDDGHQTITDGCPFCADIAAVETYDRKYQAWRRRRHLPEPTPPAPATYIPIDQVPYTDREDPRE